MFVLQYKSTFSSVSLFEKFNEAITIEMAKSFSLMPLLTAMPVFLFLFYPGLKGILLALMMKRNMTVCRVSAELKY